VTPILAFRERVQSNTVENFTSNSVENDIFDCHFANYSAQLFARYLG
jgi:hypothetical protein